jgi:hypothetical protein
MKPPQEQRIYLTNMVTQDPQTSGGRLLLGMRSCGDSGAHIFERSEPFLETSVWRVVLIPPGQKVHPLSTDHDRQGRRQAARSLCWIARVRASPNLSKAAGLLRF